MNLKQQHLEAIKQTQDEFMKVWHYSPSQAATACEAITLEHMGKFAEWADERDYCYLPAEQLWENEWDTQVFTTSELIALYFESINPKP